MDSVARPHVACLLVTVGLDEGEVGACSGPSGHGSVYLKGTNLYELVDSKVWRAFLKEVPI